MSLIKEREDQMDEISIFHAYSFDIQYRSGWFTFSGVDPDERFYMSENEAKNLRDWLNWLLGEN